MKSIERLAFENCYNLRSVTLQPGLTSIGWSAFNYCTSLTSITIPATVEYLGDSEVQGDVFNYCTSLSTINILAMTAPLKGSIIFHQVPASAIHVPVGATGYGTTYGGLSVIYDL